MSTTRDLITAAARLINVVDATESLTDEDAQAFERALNGMIDSWSNNRLMIHGIKQYVHTLTPSNPSFTIGPGGDLDVVRPLAIEQMNARFGVGSAQVDLPMQPLTDAQYATIPMKNLGNLYPRRYYDDRAYPLRTVTLYPVPGTLSVVVWLREPLLTYATLDDVISLPPGYERAFRFNLAVEIAPEFGKEVGEPIASIASAAKLELERLNSVPRYLTGDGAMSRYNNRYFPILTGGFNSGWGSF